MTACDNTGEVPRKAIAHITTTAMMIVITKPFLGTTLYLTMLWTVTANVAMNTNLAAPPKAIRNTVIV